MKTSVNKRVSSSARKAAGTRRGVSQPAGATGTIRRIGNEWAKHWNAGDLDQVVQAYAPDAVYLPPHHEAVHGRNSIQAYLETPLGRGVRDLAFEVTYIKQSGNVAWDVGTYRMTLPQPDGTKKEDHGKYLTVWKRVGTKWLIAADSWSSDLPPGH